MVDEITKEQALKLVDTLNKENKELKEKIKIKHDGFMASVDECCEYSTILDKFEKWLDEFIEYSKGVPKFSIEIRAYENCLNKLQELKEGNK